MAENLISKPWYPKVDHNEKTRNFVYLKTLQEDNPQIYNKAQLVMASVQHNLWENLWPQVGALQQLAIRERDKEDRLLDLFFNESSTGDPRKTADRIRAFNKIYQKKSIFERNLQKVKQFTSGESKQGKIDISTLFNRYLEDELKKIGSKTLKQLNEDFFLEVTKNALIKMFSAQDQQSGNSEEMIHSYQEIANIIEDMSASDQYLREVCQLYFGSSIEKIQKQVKEGHGRKKRKAESLISKQKGAHGNVFELTNELIYKMLNFNSKHTGTSGQKADHILLYSATVNLDMPNAAVEESVREHFINQYQKFYNSLDDVYGQIVEISDKSYDIGSSWFKKNGGFTAQSGISIENFEKTLQAYGYNQKRLDDLIFALLNIGPDTLSKDDGSLANNISSLIGYFLFDDIDMDVGLKFDAIHLFNLNGIYIPLSSFLFAAYEAFVSSRGNFDGYIQVNYEPEAVDFTESERLTEENWIKVKEQKLDQKALSVHFLKNFADFVSRYL